MKERKKEWKDKRLSRALNLSPDQASALSHYSGKKFVSPFSLMNLNIRVLPDIAESIEIVPF